MNQIMTKSTDDKIRDFCKLQYACQQLLDSLNVVYDLAITHEELEELANSEDAVDQALAVSPCMSIASYLKLLKDSVDLMEIYNYYEFDPNETPVDEFITMDHIAPSNGSSSDNEPINESMDNLNIDTNDVDRNVQNKIGPQISNNTKTINEKETSVDKTPQLVSKGESLDLHGSSNSNKSTSEKSNERDNKKNNEKKNPNNNNKKKNTPQSKGKTRRFDPSLDGNFNSSRSNSRRASRSFKSRDNSSNKTFFKNEKFEGGNTESSLKLHKALAKHNLVPEYDIRRLKNGSFEATCRIKGMNKIISKGYGRDKNTAQRNAANMVFTSQTLIDILSSRM